MANFILQSVVPICTVHINREKVASVQGLIIGCLIILFLFFADRLVKLSGEPLGIFLKCLFLEEPTKWAQIFWQALKTVSVSLAVNINKNILRHLKY